MHRGGIKTPPKRLQLIAEMAMDLFAQLIDPRPVAQARIDPARVIRPGHRVAQSKAQARGLPDFACNVPQFQPGNIANAANRKIR